MQIATQRHVQDIGTTNSIVFSMMMGDCVLQRFSASQHRSRDFNNHVRKIALEMEKGSFLLGALGKSFKDILRGALDSEQVQ